MLKFFLILACAASVAHAEPQLRLTSNVIWSQPGKWFGGFSGAEVTSNGHNITLITDRATLVTASMVREDGTLVTLTDVGHRPLTDASGTTLTKRRKDAEGLAIDAQGRGFVSFERDHRVVELDLASGQTSGGTPLTGSADLRANAGLEALAVHPNGTLYTLPERSGGKTQPFPVYTLENHQWRVAHHIPRRGPFAPVGADFDDDGLFYLLERAVTPVGFRSRIRRFDFSAPRIKEDILITTNASAFDNFEAISVWQGTSGQTHLTLVSDDNFLAIQHTQIVEFILTE